MNKKKVKVYSTLGCSQCATVKEFFKDNNIEFEDIDVSQDEKLQDEIIKRSGFMGVPITEIDSKFIYGFDKKKLIEFLEIKK